MFTNHRSRIRLSFISFILEQTAEFSLIKSGPTKERGSKQSPEIALEKPQNQINCGKIHSVCKYLWNMKELSDFLLKIKVLGAKVFQKTLTKGFKRPSARPLPYQVISDMRL
jgi:hypothetical protein